MGGNSFDELYVYDYASGGISRPDWQRYGDYGAIAVPEPATLLLLVGAAAAGLLRRKRS